MAEQAGIKRIKFLSAEIEKNEDNLRQPLDIVLDGSDVQAEKLRPYLTSLNKIIDVENLIILAGSGTSLTFNRHDSHIAPSMSDLWYACKDETLELFDLVLAAVKYDSIAQHDSQGVPVKDIELLLSLCDSYIELGCLSERRNNQLRRFLAKAKTVIIGETDFTANIPEGLWKYHDRFLNALARRSPNQKRLKLFTTNYDLAFERSASNIGMIVIDGFEYTNPARFNPSWFSYDVVNRASANDRGGSYLTNVFQLYKLHGSVDWIKVNGEIQKRSFNTKFGEPVFIYPSNTKYQNSYDTPYLDMVSAFLEALHKPKTALMCLGFGFNDKHLNNAIVMALRTNPEFMMMTVTKDPFNLNGSFNSQMRNVMMQAIEAGDTRISIADCEFDVFSNLLPDRHKASPESELYKIFEKIANSLDAQ